MAQPISSEKSDENRSFVAFSDYSQSSLMTICGYCKRFGPVGRDIIEIKDVIMEDYETLINHGWLRNGTLLYKPMSPTCCPLYTIRCDAVDFQLTRSQKKVLNKMYNFLAFGSEMKPPKTTHDASSCNSSTKKDHSLESILSKTMPLNPAHVLRTRWVNYSKDASSIECRKEVCELFEKYQLIVHKEHTGSDFARFLKSPLHSQIERVWSADSAEDMPVYGTFHLEYILDGTLIGVDVLDILSDSVTSQYFFYDPDYRFLSIGTYSVLREIALVRQMQKRHVNLRYISLDVYNYSCPVLQYKIKFQPSFLLCPETFTWHPLEKCLAILQAAELKGQSNFYQRFADMNKQGTERETHGFVDKCLIQVDGKVIDFKRFKAAFRRKRRQSKAVMNEEFGRIERYAQLVGDMCAKSMVILYDDVYSIWQEDDHGCACFPKKITI